MTSARWEQLSEAIREREGWHLEEDGFGEPIWCFPPEGGRLVLSVDSEGFHIYISNREDHDFVVQTVDEVLGWLDENESRYSDPPAVYRELFDHLLPGEVEKWKDEMDE